MLVKTSSMSSTGFIRSKHVVEWEFDSSCLQSETFELKSPVFDLKPPNFPKLYLFLYGNASDDILHIGLQRISKECKKVCQRVDLMVNIQFKCGKSNDIQICDPILWFNDTLKVICSGRRRFIRQILNLQQEVLKIQCVMEISEHVNCVENSIFEYTFNPLEDKDLLWTDLVDDFSAIMADREFTDVLLIVNGQEFRAHSVILAARSQTFAKLLKNHRFKDEVRLVIDDIPRAVMGHFLKYLYTGLIGVLTSQELLTLFVVADIYKLVFLQDFCSECLHCTMEADIAIKAVIATTRHPDVKLRMAAEKIIVENPERILDTDEWLEFMKDYPKTAKEIFLKCLNHSKNAIQL